MYRIPHYVIALESGSLLKPVLLPGLQVEGLEFNSRYVQEYSLLNITQTGSGAHPMSYAMITAGYLAGGKVTGA
jgi:hypothetical protein